MLLRIFMMRKEMKSMSEKEKKVIVPNECSPCRWLVVLIVGLLIGFVAVATALGGTLIAASYRKFCK